MWSRRSEHHKVNGCSFFSPFLFLFMFFLPLRIALPFVFRDVRFFFSSGYRRGLFSPGFSYVKVTDSREMPSSILLYERSNNKNKKRRTVGVPSWRFGECLCLCFHGRQTLSVAAADKEANHMFLSVYVGAAATSGPRSATGPLRAAAHYTVQQRLPSALTPPRPPDHQARGRL